MPFVTAAFTLFLLGAATAYVTLPHALGFLSPWVARTCKPFTIRSPTWDCILLMMALFGLTFQFPVVLVSLELARVGHSGQVASLLALGRHQHHGCLCGSHSELGPLLHAGPGLAAGVLLLHLHRHREKLFGR